MTAWLIDLHITQLWDTAGWYDMLYLYAYVQQQQQAAVSCGSPLTVEAMARFRWSMFPGEVERRVVLLRYGRGRAGLARVFALSQSVTGGAAKCVGSENAA